MRNSNKLNIDKLTAKILKETLEDKANMLHSKLKKNINELGGMEDYHPIWGNTNLEKLSSEDKERLMRKAQGLPDDSEIEDLMSEPISHRDSEKEIEFDYEYEDDEDDEDEEEYGFGDNVEFQEGFDSEEAKDFRSGFWGRPKDYEDDDEFVPVPPGKEKYAGLDFDSMDLRKYMGHFPDDDGSTDDDDEFEGEGDDFELAEGDGKSVCEQCGSNKGLMEGECSECGWSKSQMEEDIYDEYDLSKKGNDNFDYVGEEESFEDMGMKGNKERCEAIRDVVRKQGEITNFDREQAEMNDCGPITESLSKKQKKYLDKNKNNKIDAEDFKLLRKHKNKMETKEGKKKFPDLSGDGKVTYKDILMGRGVKLKKEEVGEGKKFIQKATEKMSNKGTEGKFGAWCKRNGLDDNGEVTKKCIDKAMKSKDSSVVKMANFAKNIKGYKGSEHKKSVKLTESEMIDLIERIVIQEKRKLTGTKTPRGLEVYNKAHKGSGKENDEYFKSLNKKMKDYLKDGSKGDFSMEPKMFPKGNGQLSKMNTKSYRISDAGKEFLDDFQRPGMENLDYDEIHPNEDWMKDTIEGSSKTGNNPEWANAEKTEVNKKLNDKRKKNIYAKAKRKAYQKSSQPVINDKTGDEDGTGLHIKVESKNTKNEKILNEEMKLMKDLISYNRATQ